MASTPERMGLVYSAFLLLYTLAMLPGGWFIDRFGPRVALMVLCFGSTVFVALTGVVGFLAEGPGTLWLGLLVVRSLLGLLNAPLHPASARMVFERVPLDLAGDGQWTGHRRGLRGDRGDLLRPGGAHRSLRLADRVPDLRRTDLARGAGVDRRHAPHERPVGLARRGPSAFDLSALWPILRRRGVVCITLSYAAYGYFQYLFFYWIQYYFETMQKVDRGVSRGYSTMITLAMGIGMLGGGWLADRIPQSAFAPMAEGPGAGAGDDRQRRRLRAGAARCRMRGSPWRRSPSRPACSASARRASGRRSSSWAAPSAGRPPG